MEQNDWTRQLHDRLADHKTAVPDGLWDNIEQRLDAQCKPRKRPVVLRMAPWMAAAASVALLIGGAFYTSRNATAPVAAPLSVARSVGQSGAGASSAASEASPGGLLALAGKRNAAAAHAVDASAAAEPSTAMALAEGTPDTELQQSVGQNGEEEAATSAGQAPEEAPAAHKQGARRSGNNHSVATAPAAYAAAYGHRSTRGTASRWSVGAHTGNAFAESNSTSGAVPVVGYYASSGKNTDDMLFCSYPSLFANYKEVKHHNQPLAVGASVSYAINKRVSLSTGLVYTRVTSDFVQQAGSDEIVDNQRLHYIGVPLGVSCNVWSNRSVRAYATMGAQVDFNVKATLASDGVSSDIGKDRPQVSGTAGVGIEYDIVPQVGLYAEPGVRYYFNNHSAVDNIFKSQPWAFNLQVGVRINVK